MKGIVDRIEGEFLVVELENGDMIDIPIEKVLKAKEGDVLLIAEEITIDEEETKRRSVDVRKLFDDLLE